MAQSKKKKKFFDVEIPLIDKETQLLGYEIEELNDKYIEYDLTRMLRGKSVLLQLKVKIEDGKATSNPVKLEVLSYFIRKMIRKGTNYVEDSFSVNCKDAVLTIKPFLITRRKISRAVRNVLRIKAKEEITNYVKDKKAENIFDEVIKNYMQKTLSIKLKKVYPLSLCEIRFIKIDKNL